MTEMENLVDLVSEMTYLVESMHDFMTMTPTYVNQDDENARKIKIEMIKYLNTIRRIRNTTNFNNLKKLLNQKNST